MMDIADFVAVNSIKLIGACFLISVFHINFTCGRLCHHKHPKVHDVSLFDCFSLTNLT